MLSAFWLIWLGFMFVFLVAPVGYGWGYRGWGAPYPRYVQQRRAQQAGTVGSSFNHHAWGFGGDLVWVGLVIAAMWAGMALFWMR